MSEPAVRARQPIDLEEFERRLRSGSPARKPSGDPLAELARLVGQDDPFKRAFPKLAPSRDTAAPPAVAARLQLMEPVYANDEPNVDAPGGHDARGSFAPELGSAHGDYDHEAPGAEAGELYAYAPADAHAAEAHFASEAPGDFADDAHHFDGAEGSDADGVPEAAIAASALAAEDAMPRRSVRGVILLIAVLSAGAAGFWASVHAKGSVMAFATGGRQPPVILAGGPTKVQSPDAAATGTPHVTASVLDKGGSDASGKAKIVSTEELPVDLSQQPKPAQLVASAGPAVPAAPAAPPPAPVAPQPAAAAPPAAAATVDPMPVAAVRPVPLRAMAAASPPPAAPSPSLPTLTSAAPVAEAPPPASPEPTTGRNGFPVPKRVKVVPVRADGSFVGSDAPSASAAVAALAPAPAAAAPDASRSSAQAFAAITPLTLTPAPAPADAAPADASQQPAPVHKPRPGRGDKAAAKPKTQVAGDAASPDAAAPATPRPKKPKGTQVADAADSDSAATAAGRFAVQLAASPSEQDARDSLQRLSKKYSSELGPHKTTFHRVQVGDKTVYRVRVGNLSRDEATQLCSKLQTSGGSCFVAGQN